MRPPALVTFYVTFRSSSPHASPPQGRNAYVEKRAPDFSKFKRLP